MLLVKHLLLVGLIYKRCKLVPCLAGRACFERRSHTEFIKSKETGEYFFLETSRGVGGANPAAMVEASSGINPWGEWTRIEDTVLKNGY